MKLLDQKMRFALVGAFNTALDFVLFLLLSMTITPVLANYISTTICLLFSFFINRSYTFRSVGGQLHKQVALFFIFTGIALWVLQPLVIAGCLYGIEEFGWSQDVVTLTAAKLAATVVSLVWNYLTYSRFVFSPSDKTK